MLSEKLLKMPKIDLHCHLDGSLPLDIVQSLYGKPVTIQELQEAILERMGRNGPVTEQMKRDVLENVYHNSLMNWIKSFR